MMLIAKKRSNPAVDLAPFGHWTLRDEAAPGRSPLRWASLAKYHHLWQANTRTFNIKSEFAPDLILAMPNDSCR